MLNEQLRDIIACPKCKERLIEFRCDQCGIGYPQIDGIPILIDDKTSLFSISDFTDGRDTTYRTDTSGLKAFLKRMIPSITLSVKSASNFEKFAGELKKRTARPRVLIVGGAVEGAGLDLERFAVDFDLVETDVAFGSRTAIICDAHDLPFIPGSFDGVIAQAVLEHVIDPFRCVAEIHRVLAPGGVVYAESPFMAQVHLGRYDFLRFSHLAHRRLFRDFVEIESGATCGTGTALAWSWCYFLQSFFRSDGGRRAAFALGSFSAFWLKYFDYALIDRPGTLDAALSLYFLGERSDRTLPDSDLIEGYRGAMN